MNRTELKAKWNEQKGKLKQKFASLTDNDFEFKKGRREEMMGTLQVKLGKTRQELRTIISNL